MIDAPFAFAGAFTGFVVGLTGVDLGEHLNSIYLVFLVIFVVSIVSCWVHGFCR